ETDEHWFK
ncbi:arginine repressor, partial [Vibrio parahaemolyticus EKP-028]